MGLWTWTASVPTVGYSRLSFLLIAILHLCTTVATGTAAAQAEGQRAEQQQVAAEKQVLSKLDKIKLDQGQRAAALEAAAREEELQASAAGSPRPVLLIKCTRDKN